MKDNNDEKTEVIIKASLDENKQKKLGHVDKDMLFGITYIGRLLMTIYSFHGLFFLYNIIIQYIILIPGLLYEINDSTGRLILSMIYIIFAISSSNILVIPTYEFMTFPFLMYKNPLAHLQSFYFIFRELSCDTEKLINEKTFYTKCISLFLFLIQTFYLIEILLAFASITIIVVDYVKFIILVIIYFYYLTIILCYFTSSLYFSIKFIFTHINDETKFRKIIIDKINKYFEDKPDIPNINLLSDLINPLLIKNYDFSALKEKEEENWYFEDWIFMIGIIIKIVTIIFSLIAFSFIFTFIDSIDWLSCILFIILFLIMSTLSLSFNFPFGYRNFKTYGICKRKRRFIFRCNYCNPKVKYKPLVRHPIIISVTRLICDFIITIVAIALIGIYYIHQDNDNIKDNFDNIIPKDNYTIINDKLYPNICHSSIYNIPLQLYLPFINDAYYYNNNHSNKIGPNYDSSLQIENYKNIFYSKDYDINVIGNLIKEKNTVKMVQYNVINSKNEITIL